MLIYENHVRKYTVPTVGKENLDRARDMVNGLIGVSVSLCISLPFSCFFLHVYLSLGFSLSA